MRGKRACADVPAFATRWRWRCRAGGRTPARAGGRTPATPAAPPTVCAGTTCPSGTFGAPCCTTATDVMENVARAPDLYGAEFGAVAPDIAGLCYQLEQPGTLDPACPAMDQGFGLGEEMGCCTDLGTCGLMSLAGLGCLYPREGPGAACTPGAATDAGIPMDSGTAP